MGNKFPETILMIKKLRCSHLANLKQNHMSAIDSHKYDLVENYKITIITYYILSSHFNLKETMLFIIKQGSFITELAHKESFHQNESVQLKLMIEIRIQKQYFVRKPGKSY